MQMTLFRQPQPRIDAAFSRARRSDLGRGAWLEWVPGWLTSDDVVFRQLRDQVAWRSLRREMYGREVDVPRQVARLPEDGPVPEVLLHASLALNRRYGRPVSSLAANRYRHGGDSVAWHADRLGDAVADSVVAVLSLQGPRRFLLRPIGGRTTHRFDMGHGDLLVMGGSCQATWEHAVPKAKDATERISVMFRECRARPAP